tara:strand:+ start:615 stop:755 length:141 start_codon:yes stop_codon:yes gene_type:complete
MKIDAHQSACGFAEEIFLSHCPVRETKTYGSARCKEHSLPGRKDSI